MNKKLFALFILILLIATMAIPVCAYADTAAEDAVQTSQMTAEEAESSLLGMKAIACGIAISLAAGLGALGMGISVGKAAEGVSRQPEAEGKIRTTLMLGIVFMETAIIYALLVVILIIFVL
ncbi:MAG: ATP synthase F0 subunit C [Firmicutes bacterium]|nr:ATP synthase F0 subunit C [Bacillota bacterium]